MISKRPILSIITYPHPVRNLINKGIHFSMHSAPTHFLSIFKAGISLFVKHGNRFWLPLMLVRAQTSVDTHGLTSDVDE
jgi:hypothetical protein